MAPSPQKDFQDLINFSLPSAMERVRTQGQFLPYGSVMSPEGDMKPYTARDESETPTSQMLLDQLTDAFHLLGLAREVKATAIVCDVEVVPPTASERTTAVLFYLDHVEGQSVEIYVPYTISDTNEVVFGKAFGMQGKSKVFPKM